MVGHYKEDIPPPGELIRVRGLVQGVGFRPTVWRLARDCGLSGDVRNDSEGVLIHAWGDAAARERFLSRLRDEAPPLSRIDAMECAPLDTRAPRAAGFHIAASDSAGVHTGVVADAATCEACLREIRKPGDRRENYAFTNCTHCGPRLSIVRRIPYDRANTSMAEFAMCPECRREYEDPADRRFHAQPNACAQCGPDLWLERAGDAGPADNADADPIETARNLLKAGQVVAIKGVGGIHLACDATDGEAVARLRRRKWRHRKPFALMARDIDMVRRYCAVGDAEANLLRSPSAPIVLMRANQVERLADEVAPGQCCYGFMLPYSPLHHLLMDAIEAPIVLTSGNRSEEPQCIANQQARDRLGDIADALLLHDREIVNRLDDSVVRVIAGAPSLLRRSRGYAPATMRLPGGFEAAPPVLAFGGQLKSTFCLLREGEAILSQHLGDLENARANAAYRETLDLYLDLFRHCPDVLATDRHPDYLPGTLGRDWAASHALPLVQVQHHHAHLAACLADNGVAMDTPPVLGLTMDGTGYGDDGTVWGGEFLLGDYRGCRRLASMAPVPMPGGAQAIRQPWRMAYAHLCRVFQWTDLQSRCGGQPFFRSLESKPLATLDAMITAGLNCPMTSSCGRLFDSVAAVIGLCQEVTYEGQAAIELEAAVDRNTLHDEGYPFAVEHHDGLPRLEPGPMWRALLEDLGRGAPAGAMASRFHRGLAAALAAMIEHLQALYGDVWQGRVALSGGVFQNAVLGELLVERLGSMGLEVIRHMRVPANDGGLSLGQACIAAARSVNDGGSGNMHGPLSLMGEGQSHPTQAEP